MDDLVTTEWLAEHLNDANVRVVDARWYLMQPSKGGIDYRNAHIPQAIYLSVDEHLAADPLPNATTGRHPLPSAEEFAADMGAAGIGNETHVVVYDDAGGANAARVWWLLRYFGHDAVSLLDGGLIQWIAEGRPLTSHVPTYTPTTFHARANPNMVVTKEQMIALMRDKRALILDARAPERYQGQTEPVDARAGHIPGARNAPLAGNLQATDDHRFQNAGALRARFDALGANGADEIVAYCGSGVNAAANLFALHLAGYDNTRLYAASFSEWSRDPTLPIVTGAEPY
jgi:thiosulfate/3-mercaptopyruvate sulfurtransferase